MRTRVRCLVVLAFLVLNVRAAGASPVFTYQAYDGGTNTNTLAMYLSTTDAALGTLIASGTYTNGFNFGSAVGNTTLNSGATYFVHMVADCTGNPEGLWASFSLSGGDQFTASGNVSLSTATPGQWSLSTTGFGGSYVAATTASGAETTWGSVLPIPNAAVWYNSGAYSGTVYFSTEITALPEPAMFLLVLPVLYLVSCRRSGRLV